MTFLRYQTQKKNFISRDMVFDESTFPYATEKLEHQHSISWIARQELEYFDEEEPDILAQDVSSGTVDRGSPLTQAEHTVHPTSSKIGPRQNTWSTKQAPKSTPFQMQPSRFSPSVGYIFRLHWPNMCQPKMHQLPVQPPEEQWAITRIVGLIWWKAFLHLPIYQKLRHFWIMQIREVLGPGHPPQDFKTIFVIWYGTLLNYILLLLISTSRLSKVSLCIFLQII